MKHLVKILEASAWPLIVQALQDGKVAALPTETVYGLAASIHYESALKQIFTLKKRPFFDPLIVHVHSITQAQKLVSGWSPLADFLARFFWPGPLTLVLNKNDQVNGLITSGLETVAIRCPNHELALKVIRECGPVAAPSANRFGRTSPSRAQHVVDEFAESSESSDGQAELLVLDGGPCEIGLESTVVQIKDDQQIFILRPGGVTAEAVRETLKKWGKPCSVALEKSIASPGHLKHHYMPAIPVFIVSTTENFTKMKAQAGLAENSMQTPAYFKLDADPILAARNLYQQLRNLSSTGADHIVISRELTQVGGYWEAIWDRLSRAATWVSPGSGLAGLR